MRRPNQRPNFDPRNGRNNNRRPFRRNGPKRTGSPLSLDQILNKYDSLYDLHQKARQKYFEFYYRVEDSKRLKLERNFYTTIEHLRKFEEKLRPWQKDKLKERFKPYRLDLTYSGNHQLPEQGLVEVAEEQVTDPHFLEAQAARTDYSDDREESVGTYEDYKKYKGLE